MVSLSVELEPLYSLTTFTQYVLPVERDGVGSACLLHFATPSLN